MDIILCKIFFLHILSLFSGGLKWISMCSMDIQSFFETQSKLYSGYMHSNNAR